MSCYQMLTKSFVLCKHSNAWEKIMHEMKSVNEEAFKHLWKIPPRFWSKSRFRTSPRCDTLVNNMSYAFKLVSIATRAKPIMTMLEEIRVYLMQIWESNRQKISKFDDTIQPNIKKNIEKESQRTNNWIVRWMLTWLSCCHAISCMKDHHLQVDDFVPNYYKKECYEACYALVIYQVNGESLWTKTNVVDL
ncbi:unnamed protein product [Lathyrus sativus]|nr:unnamed protein product [Lathyrus sativus]